MATLTASPPTMSPPLAAKNGNTPSLPPLITSTNNQQRPKSQRPTSYTEARMSAFSSDSKASQQQESRPSSHVFPVFHSSLPYTLVRDFAYPVTHPLHYGPQADETEMSTPVSESRRMSDPALASWEDSQWSAAPPWTADSSIAGPRDQLPAMAFHDGGPPYSEDEDLQSPIVKTSRHRKQKSSSAGHERGRSPGAAGIDRSEYVDGVVYNPGDEDGPGGAIDTYPTRYHEPQHRDSNFAKPLQRKNQDYQADDHVSEEEEDSDPDDDGRYSKDYSFTIASPDEEMHGKAVALFDFESEHQNELPLKEGQIILVSYRHGQGWLVAEDPRTGESGLVPEEFVRLVKDIEGGLNGLNSVTLDDGNGDSSASPISNEPTSAHTPTPQQQDFSNHNSKPSNGSNSGEKHPPVQSTFSTSSRDFSPYRLPNKGEDNGGVSSLTSVQETEEQQR